MDAPIPQEGPRPRFSAGARRLRQIFSAPVATIWPFVRNHWQDVLLVLGFIAVILLSAYVLLKS